MWGNLFLTVTRIILLNQTRSELMKHEHQVGSLNNCVEELQQRANNLAYEGKTVRETHIRNIHEIGEMKRAQELRVDEFSMQKLRESHETIQRLISQLQEM